MLRRACETRGQTVYRRRAHLVVWDESMRVTVDPFDGLYWLPCQERTYVCLSRVDLEGLWLPVDALVGHWDWFTGKIAGVRIRSGYGPSGVCGPKYERIYPSLTADEDTGLRYWRSDYGRWCYWNYAPLAHT